MGAENITGHREDLGMPAKTEDSSVPLEIQLRGPGMQQLYSQACRQGARPVHSVRGLVVGQFRSGKTCVVRRLTGEKAVENEPITDGIEISPSRSQTNSRKLWQNDWQNNKNGTNHAPGHRQEPKEQSGKSLQNTTRGIPYRPRYRPDRASDPTRWRAGIEDDAEYTVLKLTQQEKPPKDETPTQSQQTPKLQKEEIRIHYGFTTPRSGGREASVVTTMSRQTPDIPDDVIEKAKERLQGGVTEEQLGTAEHPRLSFWDFGGQATYYGSHQCFFTYRGIYILVMSLLQKLSDPVPDQDFKAAADNLVTGRAYHILEIAE
ncbi:hypothetical protein Bbelb_284750 [Branchiostoma belcheri]|nr:hypothetical protein Bbelb_284750 [Branchiostoma belcheri]